MQPWTLLLPDVPLLLPVRLRILMLLPPVQPALLPVHAEGSAAVRAVWAEGHSMGLHGGRGRAGACFV